MIDVECGGLSKVLYTFCALCEPHSGRMGNLEMSQNTPRSFFINREIQSCLVCGVV